MRAYDTRTERFILTHIPRKGPAWVAERLGKSPQALHSWLNRRGIVAGAVQGHMRLWEVAAEAGVSRAAVKQAAKRDNALKPCGQKRTGAVGVYVVPNAWAQKYIRQCSGINRTQELRDAGWLTRKETIAYLGMGKGGTTLDEAMSPNPARRPPAASTTILRRIRRELCRNLNPNGGRPQWLHHPQDVEVARRQLDELRRSR